MFSEQLSGQMFFLVKCELKLVFEIAIYISQNTQFGSLDGNMMKISVSLSLTSLDLNFILFFIQSLFLRIVNELYDSLCWTQATFQFSRNALAASSGKKTFSFNFGFMKIKTVHFQQAKIVYVYCRSSQLRRFKYSTTSVYFNQFQINFTCFLYSIVI